MAISGIKRVTKRHAAFSKYLVENPDMTYNDVSKNFFDGSMCVYGKFIHDSLVAEGIIEDRSIKFHDPSKERKFRRPVTTSVERKFMHMANNNPGASIQKLSKMVGISFGAGYNIHDKLVLAGKIKTHRKIKTVAANTPPLFVIEKMVLDYVSGMESPKYTHVAKALGLSVGYVTKVMKENGM